MENKVRQLLKSEVTSYLMEAHNAISAKIVENNCFDGIWISGLTVSASYGMRDFSEVSYSSMLNVVEAVSDGVNIPIVVDIDSGYGDFNNARIVAQKSFKLGASAVCIEDKMFPKMNSFIKSETQILCDISEFAGKIAAIKDKVKSDDFMVIARTEALISEKGVEEALKRAEAYYRAGADAIFIHSKSDSIKEIEEFMFYWNLKCPIVIAPTTYANQNAKVYSNLKISMVIWANHMLRASICNMDKVAKRIYENKYPPRYDSEIADMSEIFRLQDIDEYFKAKRKYARILQ